ncbi:MAG: 3-oxoacyl-[acyl-carrier-protein] reductase FabG [Anaerolineales bacterium]|nr:3-oxoacyl-[acyl-carrier-protein] reductase FabG [Anaerolineales bacterium]
MASGISMEGRIAVVTGAGGGIGSAISRRLAAAGAKVVLNYRQSEGGTKAVAESLAGDGHMVIQADVSDSEALTRMAERVADRYGMLDLLVNNAGITRPVPHDDLEGLTDELFDKILQVNLRGAFACIRAFKELLADGDGGMIVNISSISGRTGIGSNVAYCASKAALDNMTISLGRALGPEIRVVAMWLGWVMGEYAKRVDAEYLQEQIDKTPLDRLATPEDVADAVLAAATTLTFSTGCIIPVDGGRPFV